MEKIVKKYSSFEEAEKAETEYWRNASYEERINTFLEMQEMMIKLFYPGAKRMEKIKIIKKRGEE